VRKLSEEEIGLAIARDLPGWRLAEGEILKNYKFPSFMDAIAFITRVAEKAEAANHHPDLENHYNRVRVAIHTWSENGITQKDIALAREIESVADVGPGD
jgi:4a-hydroxytetrahydrobiopterin dehydratase